jgi:hypothetical protein
MLTPIRDPTVPGHQYCTTYDGVDFKRTAYAFDRDARRMALSQLLKDAMGEGSRQGPVNAFDSLTFNDRPAA